MEEVYYDGPSVGNGTYSTSGVVKKRLQNIKKSEVYTYLNATDNNSIEEYTVNEKTQYSSKVVNYDTSVDNVVYGTVVKYQFK